VHDAEMVNIESSSISEERLEEHGMKQKMEPAIIRNRTYDGFDAIESMLLYVTFASTIRLPS
jgi:hypothetical protein